jgi:hypothetical protein
MFLRIKLFFVFLYWCFRYPKDIRENWEDMKFRYFMETDPEIKKLTKQLEDESNIFRP